ncbi:MAG TPA: amidohydrolase family protein [Solirubrobacteraceae bacterium]|nr:amidohydrolase family protein [Solirubrobacteraceae bacterium]
MIVDAHVHVFRPASVHPRATDELAPPDRDAPVEALIGVLDGHGVDAAVLVPLGPEVEYVASAKRRYAGRFAAIAVAGPAPRALPEPFDGLRVMWLGEPGRPLAESPMLPLLRDLAAREKLLWTYLPPDQLPLLEQLPALVPDLTVVLNHLGFCPHDMRVDERGRPWFADPLPPERVDVVRRLAGAERFHLMLSGQYALSRESPPYRDLDGAIATLADAYGAERMLWASDWPWIDAEPGYRALLDLPAQCLPGASAAELDAVRGGTALRLFPTLRGD